ncbi:MAG: 6-phosphogluconolactonase [Bryobacterales bacterium]|nr:6-phosphogluconolactonase [Bryobacteraceae bacterium]MDW8129103.1 6-phosphogluconolactonase [Bryobacterales bacterium]
MGARWFRYPNARLAAEACAHNILAKLEDALSGRSLATLVLSGGEESGLLLEALARSRFAWQQVHLFWAEERAGIQREAGSHYRLAAECFIGPARVPARNVHRIRVELAPEVAASRYEQEIREFFGLEPGEFPRFDAVHRDLGADGHTAGLFPGDPLIGNRDGLASAVYLESLGEWRVTLLPGALLAAGHTVYLVAGAEKAPAVRAVFCDPYDPARHPAQMDSHHARSVCWFLDEAAARLLD